MRAYLDVESSVGKKRIFLELFPDRAPLACKNFAALCAAPDGYKNSEIHRIVAPEFIVQGGDVGRSEIDGGQFPVESAGWSDLNEGGYLCMASNEQGMNLCQWFITLEAYPHLSQKNTVFGRLLEPGALDYLKGLGSLEVDENYRPLESVRVVKCGQMRWEEESKGETEGTKNRARSRSPRRSERSRSRSPRRSRHRSHRSRVKGEEGPRSAERDKKGFDIRKKKRREEERYRDRSDATRRLRDWEDRHSRPRRDVSPSERISSERMKEDINRHMQSSGGEKPARRHYVPPVRSSEDADEIKIVRKGRGTPKFGSSFGSHSGRLGRPG